MTSPTHNASDKAPLDAVRAGELLDELAQQPTLVRLNQASAKLGEIKSVLGRVPVRLGCVSSFTLDPLKSVLELQAARAGMALESYIAPFGQFERVLIDPAAGLAGFRPDAVLVAVRLADVCPQLYSDFNGLKDGEAFALLDGWFDRLAVALQTFRQRSNAYLLIQNDEQPVNPALGIADAVSPGSQSEFIRTANRRLVDLAGTIPNTFVLDYDALVARVGRENWCDDRTRLYARIPVASRHYWRWAGFYVRHLRPLFGLTKKVIVLDADHTLWGGVVGDVGMHGIQLGHDFPGNAFIEFQQRILELHRRGVLLAIASKNEPGSVEQVLASHEEMVLKPNHFASMRVNWNPKPQSLQEIAEELNLGLDSFVFMDDSPVECDLMRKSLPQVLTVHLPRDPAGYPAIVDGLDCFDQWTISNEDRRRGDMYRAESERRQLKSAAIDMQSFYRQLDMTMVVSINQPAHVARASQMTNRTNQFNMHTRRCSEDDIRRLSTDGTHEVVTVALADKFGENGIIGMAVVGTGADAWTVRQFLMSCRVLGRAVETTLLRWIALRARAAGAKRLLAEFVPTGKNKPFSGFFADCGLSRAQATGDIQIWELGLERFEETLPDWIKVVVQAD